MGNWDSSEYREKFWHSSSHLLASAVKELFPKAKFAIGPAIEEGFYYDFDIENPFTPADFEKLEKKMIEIAAKKEKFLKKEVSKKDALQLFKNQPYKIELINDLEEGKISVFTNGNFSDLCKGPHLESTEPIKAVKLLRSSGAYWKGSEKNKMLQRIYGISFPEKKMLEEWLAKKEEAEKRSHIKLGKELDLFSFQKEAPGAAFYHNNSTQIWTELTDYLRREQRKLGYLEVITPLIMKDSLWKQSGHWDHYKENMYFLKIDGEDYAVKPMNCPGHILIYKNSRKSYRELPVKMSEFGIVHRHEKSGVLNGLFRVRKFTQDDAHLFCTPEQIKPVIKETIQLIGRIYKTCGFSEYHIELSTRPENSMGSKEQWDKAEQALKEALEETKSQYKLNPGDGTFYGPKIDFHIKDSLGRTWQCGTIQLDFQMPQKFELEYIGSDDKPHTPVMVHRALYGSLDRFLAILTEHFGGAFPLWLAPVQIKILAIADRHAPYAEKIAKEMQGKNLRVKINLEQETISAKVRQAELEKVPLILVVGDREEKENTVAVRKRGSNKTETKKTIDFIEETLKEIEDKK
ncbi:MAG: threonine--tRNA ligase [Candidatus ainarchaeum sp.]|nr:threonine--tRNA ligase [Candidatus ainarchaeum sp.]